MTRATSTSRRRFTKVLASASLVGTTFLAGCGDESAYGGGDGDAGGGGGDGDGDGDGGNDSDDGGGDNGGSDSPYGRFFDNTDNFDGVQDETGTDSVTVMVGAEGNGGNFAFEPPAVQISNETTVQWEWTGEGSQHNVVEQDGAFESELYEEAGVHFEHEFTESGTFRYVCQPHDSMGMRGVIEVE